MKKPTDSRTPQYRRSEDRIASDYEKSEQIRELEELQRNLAERIGKIERAATQNREDKAG